jgi:2-keto-4-pentenoate hydratase/2-oxohepta-3-ene-1,7-dioic acid hydratase in catechol pathway
MNVELPLSHGPGSFTVAPSKIIALGLNYHAHIQESLSVKVRGFDPEVPPEPILFPKLPSSLLGPEGEIVLPKIVDSYEFEEPRTDHEAELAVIIGLGGKNISEAHALEHIYGFTCANDVSQRNIQNGDRSGWFRGKSFDTFCPVGPVVVPVSELPNVQDLKVSCRVNGEVRQEGRTSQMIFTLPEIIAFISRNFTLQEGDLILTGTPSGVAPIKDGDVVEIEIEGIGTLRNPVRKEA